MKTGLSIASHTGPANLAFEQIEELKKQGVHPEAFIWVHAQAEKDKSTYAKAAREGAWISLDGLNDENVADYSIMLIDLKKQGLLHKVLLSHDAGWYDPEKPEGGEFRHFLTLFKKLIPGLTAKGFTKKEIKTLIEDNPEKAFGMRVRSM